MITLKELEEIEAQLDSSVPYYLPQLVKDMKLLLAKQTEQVTAHIYDVREREDNTGRLTEFFLHGRNISLLITAEPGSQFTYSLIVDGQMKEMGEVNVMDREADEVEA